MLTRTRRRPRTRSWPPAGASRRTDRTMGSAGTQSLPTPLSHPCVSPLGFPGAPWHDLAVVAVPRRLFTTGSAGRTTHRLGGAGGQVLSAFVRAFRTPDLRRKLLLPLGIMVVFRVGSIVPTPGVSYTNVQACIAQSAANTTLQGVATPYSAAA